MKIFKKYHELFPQVKQKCKLYVNVLRSPANKKTRK
jgi:hypothetical protein